MNFKKKFDFIYCKSRLREGGIDREVDKLYISKENRQLS